MKKNFLCVLLGFVLLISTPAIVLAENDGEGSEGPEFTIQAEHQKFREGLNDYPMVLTLTNNTDKTITVTGDEDDKVTIKVRSNPNPRAEKESFKYELYKGVESITIEPGDTEKIVKVPTGAPGSWEAFYHPSLITDMDVEINIKIEEETILQTFSGISYGIMGIIRNPLYMGKVKAIDNEDGTATLKFNLTAYDEINEVACNDPRCNDNECCVIGTQPKKIGPKEGLKKTDFSILKENSSLGEIIQVKEINAGEYELVWQHKAGIFEDMILNTASGYGEFFVTDIPKDANGNFILYERFTNFNVTITHTKEPVVIKHEDATLETVGATNIPKLVNLFFKVIDSDIDEDSMKLLEKGIQKTIVNKEIVHVYDISLLLDGEEIQPDGSVKITIPLDDQMKKYVDLKVVYISDTGEVTEVECETTDNGISFITDHFSYYAVLGTSKDDVPKSPKTGDSATHYALFIGLMGLVGMGIVLKRNTVSN